MHKCSNKGFLCLFINIRQWNKSNKISYTLYTARAVFPDDAADWGFEHSGGELQFIKCKHRLKAHRLQAQCRAADSATTTLGLKLTCSASAEMDDVLKLFKPCRFCAEVKHLQICLMSSKVATCASWWLLAALSAVVPSGNVMRT